MKIEEHKEIINTIRSNLDNEGLVVENLMKLVEDYGLISGDLAKTNEKNESLEKANESLRNVNMELFQKVGTKLPIEKENKIETNDNEVKEMKFENLFKNGELI